MLLEKQCTTVLSPTVHIDFSKISEISISKFSILNQVISRYFDISRSRFYYIPPQLDSLKVQQFLQAYLSSICIYQCGCLQHYFCLMFCITTSSTIWKKSETKPSFVDVCPPAIGKCSYGSKMYKKFQTSPLNLEIFLINMEQKATIY